MSRENQKQRSKKIKEDILDVALDLAISDGFEALSMRKISKKMKYTTGVIYYYFKDKQEIVDEIQKRQSDEIRKIIREKVCAEKGFEFNLREVFHNMMLIALNEPMKYNLVTLYRHKRGASIDYSYLDVLKKFLELGVKNGELIVADIDYTAFSIWSSFIGFNLNISQLEKISIEEANILFDVHVNIIMDGIRS
ncbi:TetR/AcrR family transcriptional regulator [Clostridioides mangenotii]|uniref:TetR/AcrR family transcriptional regulator n=1 Tax=Metaclostridioides mangenotii TaxID=1540 RepID=UPI002149C4FE|nr:TetR/AcrR family transcriptional regulator [Clostridioides mangenotii]MCR1954221.1 TetR/AcrR family transcriptional regulator [Clostridioides mangenotii]